MIVIGGSELRGGENALKAGGWVEGKEDTNSFPDPGEMTTTRDRSRIHNVPLGTRFLLEQ